MRLGGLWDRSYLGGASLHRLVGHLLPTAGRFNFRMVATLMLSGYSVLLLLLLSWLVLAVGVIDWMEESGVFGDMPVISEMLLAF